MLAPGQTHLTVLGDAYELLNQVPDKSVDLILMDPPYNVHEYSEEIEVKGRENVSKTADWDKNFDPARLIEPIQRVLKPKGNVFAFTSFNMFGPWHQTYDPLFDVFQFMVWKKTNPTLSFRKKSFLNSIEQIVCFWNEGHTWNFLTQKEMHNEIRGPICMGRERVKHPVTGKSLHPHQKPLYVLRHIIQIASNPGDLVLDPFAGMFSSGVASLRRGRRYIGFEKDPLYYQEGIKRLVGVDAEIDVRLKMRASA